MSDFAARKQRVLDNLVTPEVSEQGVVDKSPKGFVDEPIVDLIEFLNSMEQYYTTSSCSGRISLFALPISTSILKGEWLLSEHRRVSLKETIEALESADSAIASVSLKFEPFILAIDCISIDAATKMLHIARDVSGFRDSGITLSTGSTVEKRIILTVRCPVRMDTPVLQRGVFDISPDQLKFLVQFANNKFDENAKRIERFFNDLREHFGISEDKRETLQNYSIKLPRNQLKLLKVLLQEKGFADTKVRRIEKMSDDPSYFLFPLNSSGFEYFYNLNIQRLDLSSFHSSEALKGEPICIITQKVPLEKPRQLSPLEQLQTALLQLPNVTESMISEIPSKWEKLGDLVLLPQEAFSGRKWDTMRTNTLWKIVASVLGAERVGQQQPVKEGPTRRSAAEILLGDHGNVVHKENGVLYVFDVTNCMFSSGNGTERKRMGLKPLPNEIVVDLYAGIGYFTLSMLVHSKARHIYACEWVEQSIDALRKGVQANNIDTSRISIFHGDNRLESINSVFRGKADRVLLGLLPSSEDGWSIAVESLKGTGGMLHLHANVPNMREKEYGSFVCHRLMQLAKMSSDAKKHKWNVHIEHIERVKWYAPKIRHVVYDIRCEFSYYPPIKAQVSRLRLSSRAIASIQFEDFDSKSRVPVVLKGVDFGSCVEKWSPSYLQSKINRNVAVHVCPSRDLDFNHRNFKYERMSMSEAIQRANEGAGDSHFISPNERYYVRSLGEIETKDIANFWKDYPEIADDFMPPELMLKADRMFSSVFRISSKDCRLWTHYDVTDNFLFQVTGTKKVLLFHPETVDALYVKTSSSNILDIENADIAQFPYLQDLERQQDRIYECNLNPGDVLFIPALWLHSVHSQTFSVSVNTFFREIDDRYYDQQDVYGNRDHVDGAEALKKLDDSILKLDSLPEYYKRFYYSKMISKIRQFL